MKKISALFFFLLIVGMVGMVQAAEYRVRKGDSLTKIARFTGHTVSELVAMNKIENPNLIMTGRRIVFLSKDDLLAAKQWSQKRMKELMKRIRLTVLDEGNYRFFESAVQDIDSVNTRYSPDEPNGIHYSIILSFANAWRSHQQ